jgi:tripartite-type tricarboxylate transporter receptor subunit TctC
MKSRLSRSTTARRPLRSVAAAVALGAALAACGDSGGSTDTQTAPEASEADDCDGYPTEDIHLVVPFDAGGGYDAWARLMAPFLETHLGGDVNVIVDNVPGGGGVRGTNQVYMAEPDGTQYIVQSPNDLAGLQILGKTPENFDLGEMTVLGGFTEDPQVFLVSADSPVESMEDLAALPQPIRNAVTEISAVELLTYDAFGVQANFILNDGTGAAVLAVRRGDAEVTAGSLSSIIGYVRSGDLKPILYIAEEAPDESVVGYDLIQDVPTAEEEGHPGLGAVLTQLRVVAGPPGLPDCIRETMAEAVSATLADPELVKKAEEAELRVVASSAEEADQQVQDILDSLTENADILKAGLAE